MSPNTGKCHFLICFVVIVAAIAGSCQRDEPAGASKGTNGSRAAEPVARVADTLSERAPAVAAQPDVLSRPVAQENSPAGTDPTAVESRPHKAKSADGTYSVVFTTSPDPIPLNRLFAMEVEVRDANNPRRTLANITLAADAAMPHHGHGMNTQPKVRPGDTGRFIVTGMQFHMPGYWEIYFDITRGGVTERAFVAIEL